MPSLPRATRPGSPDAGTETETAHDCRARRNRAGKTVYLGMLMDILTRQIGLLRSTARGPMSISLQQTATTALATGWFPEKTAREPEHWQWVHCQFNCRRRRRPLELVIPDVSGEALADETERSGHYPAIHSLLVKCSGVMVLADAQRLQAGDHSQDYVTMKLLSLIGELRDQQPRSRRSRSHDRCPVALVLTKADACDGCLAGGPRVCRSTRHQLVERLPVAVQATRGIRLFGGRSDRLSRQLSSGGSWHACGLSRTAWSSRSAG